MLLTREGFLEVDTAQLDSATGKLVPVGLALINPEAVAHVRQIPVPEGPRLCVTMLDGAWMIVCAHYSAFTCHLFNAIHERRTAGK